MTEIEWIIDEYIKKWMLMPDNHGNRKVFPEDNWYGNDPLRVVVSHVGIDKLRGLAKAIEQYVIKARIEILISLVPNHLIIEKCLWFGKDNDSKREMCIEINHIDNDLSKPLDYEEAFKKAIAELKKRGE